MLLLSGRNCRARKLNTVYHLSKFVHVCLHLGILVCIVIGRFIKLLLLQPRIDSVRHQPQGITLIMPASGACSLSVKFQRCGWLRGVLLATWFLCCFFFSPLSEPGMVTDQLDSLRKYFRHAFRCLQHLGQKGLAYVHVLKMTTLERHFADTSRTCE